MLLCPRQPPFAMQRRPRTLRLTVMLVKHRQRKALSVSKEFYAKAAEATAFVQQPETLTYKGTGSESGGVAGSHVVDQIGYISSTGNNVTVLGVSCMTGWPRPAAVLSTHLHMQRIEFSTSTSP